MTCRQTGDIFGKLRQCGFFLFQQARRLTGHSDGLVQLFLMSLSSFRQFSRLPFEATNCVTSIAVQSGLAREMCGDGACLRFGPASLSDFLSQIILRQLPCFIGLFPTSIEQHALKFAQLFADITVTGRLFCLAFQLRHLASQLF